MDIRWLRRRLKAMNLPEILYRLERRLFFEYYKRVAAPTPKGGKALQLYLDFPFNTNIPENICDGVREYAEEIMSGNTVFFGKKVKIDPYIDWQMDPETDKLWPDKFFLDINYRDSAKKLDPKLVWEINRHQYLVAVALAYKWDRDESKAKFILDTIINWIDGNPLMYGINWVSSMEAGIRVISWTVALSLIKDRLAHFDDHNKIAESVWQHSWFIRNNLSKYSSANNHLIGELTGLLAASCFLGATNVKCAEDSGKWFAFAAEQLSKQAKKQFFSDGVNREQATNYQCHTMDYYMTAINFAATGGYEFSGEVYNVLERASTFLKFMRLDDGSDFNIGDEDAGYILPVIPIKSRTTASIELAGVTLKKASNQKNDCNFVDPRTYLMKEMNDAKKLSSIAKHCPDSFDKKSGWTSFPEGGYWIWSSELLASHGNTTEEVFDSGAKNLYRQPVRLVCVADGGPVGMSPLQAHGHADICSVLLTLGGHPVFVDSGTYRYYLEDDWRDYFKGTVSHNTLCINGDDQLQSLGRFQWAKSPSVKVKTENDTIEISHDGYQKRYGANHIRRITPLSDGIRIGDKVTGKFSGNPKVHYHLHPSARAEMLTKDTIRVTVSDEISFILRVLGEVTTTLVSGAIEPDKKGWYSPEPGEKLPTTTICIDFGLQSEMSVHLYLT